MYRTKMAAINELSDSMVLNGAEDKETDPLLISLRNHPCLINKVSEAPALRIENLSKVSGRLLINVYNQYYSGMV